MPETVEEVSARLRNEILDAVTLPGGWEEADEEYPIEENYPDDFPDDYAPQYEVVGFANDDNYIGVWWLRDGDALQPFYGDSGLFDEWGDVSDAEGVAENISERLR